MSEAALEIAAPNLADIIMHRVSEDRPQASANGSQSSGPLVAEAVDRHVGLDIGLLMEAILIDFF